MKKKLTAEQQKQLNHILGRYPHLREIIDRVADQDGQIFLVGGAVRDLLLGLPVKDIDIEVHGLTLERLAKVLAEFGVVDYVGKSFGVLRIHGLDIDWSLPRTDSTGRKPHVTINPFMSIQDAFRRRDLTINAMGVDLKSNELYDPFNGQYDLKHKILRATDRQLFIEDPLRFYRVMQFISRFSMQPDEELNAICASMDIRAISRERIEAEFEKLLLRSAKPSQGIRWLANIKRLHEVLPELAATMDVEQEPDWHPEGTVFEHLMQTIDAAAQLIRQYSDKFITNQQKLLYMWAALCHDLGKITTTIFIDGRLRSRGHDVAGVPLTKSMLKRITHNKDLIKTVALLVRYHMEPMVFIHEGAKPPAYKRLALKLAPYTTVSMLAMLSRADRMGRNPKQEKPLQEQQADCQPIQEFEKKAQLYGVADHIEKPILQGKDLLAYITPGPQLGNLIKEAYALQLQEGIRDKEELKRRVLVKK